MRQVKRDIASVRERVNELRFGGGFDLARPKRWGKSTLTKNLAEMLPCTTGSYVIPRDERITSGVRPRAPTITSH